MTPAAIRTEGLTKHYGKHVALTELNLEIGQGEVFGFLGPNGAGKSTTIRILLDLIRPTAGRVEVLGIEPRVGGARLRKRIGYLPGDLAIEGRNTARELLTFLADLRGDVAPKRIAELAELLDLDLSKKVGAMSKGNKQKVGIIAAFMHNPDLLILDEPTSGLDPLLQQRFLDLVGAAKRNGQTVFMSSHILSEVQQTADRAVIMRAGQLLGAENVEDLRRRSPRSVELIFGEDIFGDDFREIARRARYDRRRKNVALHHRRRGRRSVQDGRKIPIGERAVHRTGSRAHLFQPVRPLTTITRII